MSEQHSLALTLHRLEQLVSLLGGAALVIHGLARRSMGGAILALLGGDLLYHGLARENTHIHQVFGLEIFQEPFAVTTRPQEQGIRVQRSITINRSPEDLYHFWRNLENLPRVFEHVHAVKTLDSSHSHWIIKSPTGATLEWDSQIVDDIPNRLISWQSLPSADIPNAGSVHLDKSSNGKGTRVNVMLKYDTPVGATGNGFARLLGEIPSQTIRAELRRLKEQLEAEKINSIRLPGIVVLGSR